MVTYDSNIVLIISDALRPKDLSLYGYNIETDKNIKEIASESVVFFKNFSASNASDASLTSLFSGQLPFTNGFIHQHPFMKEEEIEKLKKLKFWLPLYLQKKKYTTISATPLHLWFKKGFDYYKERDDSKKFLNIPIIKRFLLILPKWAYSLGKKMIKARASPHFYSSEEIVNLAVEKINEAKKSFFLFMHFTDTHYPYMVSKKTEVKGEKTIGNILNEIESREQKEYLKKRFYDISAENMEEIEKRRDESIIFVDKQIGRFVSFLKEKNLWENTIFIIMSDHGDNFGEHSVYFCRGGLYDTSIHTPLIMHLPGIKPQKINELTQSIDIVPTILELLKEKSIKLDGESLVDLIKTGKPIRNKILSSDGFCEKRVAIRTSSKKLIVSDNTKCYICGAVHGKNKEMYDLEKDPEEKNNIYAENNNLEKYAKKFID